MAHKMNKEEIYEFITEGTRTGKLATVRKNGHPHVVPVWFVLDGDDLIFTTMHDTVKAKNMQRDNRVCISVDKSEPMYTFVKIDGEAEFMDVTPEEKLEWATRIARRYMGDDKAEAFGKRNAVPEEYVVRIHPTNLTGLRDLAD